MVKKTAGVYCIRNRRTGVSYVGSSHQMEQRWRQHRYNLNRGKHHCAYLLNSWSLYGEDAFEFKVLEVVADVARLIEREQHHIDLWKPGYNTAPVAGSRLGSKQSEEAKVNMKAARAKWTPEQEANRLAGLAEARARPEWLESQLAARNTPEYRARRSKLSAEQQNRHDIAAHVREHGHAGRTEESRAKISESNERQWAEMPADAREERLKKLAVAREKVSTPETRAKMSLAKKGRRSARRLDPTKCTKGLHEWVEGRHECRECTNIAQNASHARRKERAQSQ